MKKLVPIKIFYSYKGYSAIGRELMYADGELKREDLLDIRGVLLKRARENNSQVISIHILAATPLEFMEVEADD